MVKRLLLAVALVILLFALACLYVGGVASVSDRVARYLRPGPRLAPPGVGSVDNWVLFAETSHFCYYVRSGDHIPWWAMELAEDHLDAACRALHVSFPSVIQYYKHPSQLDLHETTGSRSTGVVLAVEGEHGHELHSVHGYDPHEVMHVVAHETMGEPPALFDEGLATAFGWDWTPGERDVHARTSLLLEQERLVPLERLLTNWDFRSYKSYPAYIAAGSFVKYLLAVDGPQKLSRLFELDKYSQRDEIEDRFATAYGESIYEVEAGWRAALQQGTLPATSSGPASETSRASLVIIGAILLAATFLGGALFIVAGEKVANPAIGGVRTLARTIGRLLVSGKRE